MKDIIALLRPQQWAKNLFILLPLFFGGEFFDNQMLWNAVVVFFAYSFVASAIYCFNDALDAKADRLHPIKRHRPVASGRVSRGKAMMIMVIMAGLGLTLAMTLPDVCLLVVGILVFYMVMNVLYCTWLKHIAIVDVFIISVGFVLRIVVGGIATHSFLSQWIVLMTFLLALFLAFAKRRDDVVMYENTGIKARRNVNRYNLQFMNQAISIIASITMVCYIMYTVSPDVTERLHTHYLYLTSVFVLAALIRYMQITIVDVKSGSPTKVLLSDHFIQACILLWGLAFAAIIYL